MLLLSLLLARRSSRRTPFKPAVSLGAKVFLCHPSYDKDKDKADLIGEVIGVPDSKKAVLHKRKSPAFAMKCSITGEIHLLYAELQRDSVRLADEHREKGTR